MDSSPVEVTVYITTLNRPELLDRALESLTKQTYKNFEVLICDDASEIDYLEQYANVINKYKDSFVYINLLRNESRKGACYSRNRLINESSARFITGLDDDDMFHPQRLEIFMNFMKSNCKDYSFVCSGVNSLEYNQFLRTDDFDGKVISHDDLKNLNLVGNQIFIEKDKLLTVDGFDINMPAWQDYDTWFRLTKTFGDAFKLNHTTMLLDSTEGRERITTSSNAFKGYEAFINKHLLELTKDNLLSLKYIDLINRKQKFSILNFDLIGNFRLQRTLFKYKSVYDYPQIYSLYRKYIKK